MWTYFEFHLAFTIPPLCILAVIARRVFPSRPFDGLKIALLSFIAFTYTIPWDNYIVWRQAWSYPKDRVLGVIGYVPLEEYAFFIIQTVMTSLFSSIILHFVMPVQVLHKAYCDNGKHRPSSSSIADARLLRYLPLPVFASICAWGWSIAVPQSSTFYLGCILWWTMPVVLFLWWWAAPYIAAVGWRRLCIIIGLPTAYLCAADAFAIHQGIWDISAETSLQWPLMGVLPFEEAFFFFMTNVMCVFGCLAMDFSYCAWKHAKQTLPSPSASVQHAHRGASWSLASVGAIAWFSVWLDERSMLDWKWICDAASAARVIKDGSKSFYTASMLYPTDVRQGIFELYAFCRESDDMIDGEEDDHGVALLHKHHAVVESNANENDSAPQSTSTSHAQEETPNATQDDMCYRAKASESPAVPSPQMLSSSTSSSSSSVSSSIASSSESSADDEAMEDVILHGGKQMSDKRGGDVKTLPHDEDGSIFGRSTPTIGVEQRQSLRLLSDFVDALYLENDNGPHVKRAQRCPATKSFCKKVRNGSYQGIELKQKHKIALRCMERVVNRFNVSKEEVNELVDGYRWDIAQKDIRTEEDLIGYCERVASSVGLMCCKVFDLEEAHQVASLPQPSEEHVRAKQRLGELHAAARDLGVALQLTNIARDIITDANIGRTYIPLEWFTSDLHRQEVMRNPSLHVEFIRRLALRALDLAETYYHRAKKGAYALPTDVGMPVIVAMNIYREIGTVIRQHHTYPERAVVSKLRKIVLLLGSLTGLVGV